MESEKVKEIKQDIEICMKSLNCEGCSHHSQRSGECCRNLTDDILTYINELESENERLTEERDLYKKQFNELEPRFFDLREENQQLKDRLAELEKGRTQQCIDCIEWRGANEKLKQFAERLKEQVKAKVDYYNDEVFDYSYNGITEKDINETLKEFL